MLTRLYLRASTNEQDASRARAALESFANEHGLTIAASYVENESGAKLERPSCSVYWRIAVPVTRCWWSR